MNTLRAIFDAVCAPWMINVIGVVYVLQAIGLSQHGKYGLSMAFAGYAFANIGLYMAARAA